VAETIRTIPTNASQRTVVFAHSYAALHILRAAKLRGWTTVLGQIDPGQEHFAIVRRLAEANPDYGPPPAPPPAQYFESWREECALADHVVVNSEWSREAIASAGVDVSRFHVVPLAHEGSAAAAARRYPDTFSAERPLRLLFVGSVSVAKGAAELLEAMQQVADLPVRLRVVGAMGMQVPDRLRLSSVEFTGTLPRGDLTAIYAASDVLVFPTHSDGFGMAQIEAQAAGLPIVASRNCGRVVQDGVTGLLLPDVTTTAIVAAIRRLIQEPALLRRFSEQTQAPARSSLAPLGEALTRLVEP
jgi:glycosyltransferase involved in cell wall biosynthesis